MKHDDDNIIPAGSVWRTRISTNGTTTAMGDSYIDVDRGAVFTVIAADHNSRVVEVVGESFRLFFDMALWGRPPYPKPGNISVFMERIA